MSKKMIVAANWKMNKGPKETQSFLSEFMPLFLKNKSEASCLLFAPALNLHVLSDKLAGTSIGWGAQNIYFEETGAFTGENSPLVVAQMGATHVLIGHSERRHIFLESDETVAKKVKAAQQSNLTPVICLGESLQQREAGQTNQVISKQLVEALKLADVTKTFIIAYEPVWAIGTGKVATSEQVEEAHKCLKLKLSELNTQAAVLYGGSVKAENAKALSQLPSVDGFLVGGASLNVDSFMGIIDQA